MTIRVALTGGIATGKSYVRAAIAAHGVPTIDSDLIVHELLGTPGPVTAAIAGRFGAGVLRLDGTVDRAALARLVFGDPGLRADLEAIVHPSVYQRIFAWADDEAARGVPWIVADIPLLFETGHEGEFDRVIVVACSPEAQLRRLMSRDRLPEAAARARLAAQWPIAEKVKRATDVIDTGGTFEETDRQVNAICRWIDASGRNRVPGGGR